MSKYLTVSGLAARVGVSPDAVRYYERLGLVPPARSTAGYRHYDEDAVQRLRFIKGRPAGRLAAARDRRTAGGR